MATKSQRSTSLLRVSAAGSECKIGFWLGRSLQQIETKGAHNIEARTDRQAALDVVDCDWTGERRLERIVMALQWFKASESHMEVPLKLVLDEAQCREAGLPEHVTEFRLGSTDDGIRHRGDFVQIENPRREAQHAANKHWLGVHLDKDWLWAKLS